MIADIADRFGRHIRFLERHPDSPGRLLAAFPQTHTMIRFAGRSIACDFTVQMRPSLERALAFLKNEEPRSLSHDKTIAIARKRPRRTAGRVIPAGR